VRKNDGAQHFCCQFCSLRIVPQKVQNNILNLSSVCGIKSKRLIDFFSTLTVFLNLKIVADFFILPPPAPLMILISENYNSILVHISGINPALLKYGYGEIF